MSPDPNEGLDGCLLPPAVMRHLLLDLASDAREASESALAADFDISQDLGLVIQKDLGPVGLRCSRGPRRVPEEASDLRRRPPMCSSP
jgi:hypothetical protein